jgi:two-component system, cell cycle sensor histidine kinase and response regulator CckA
MPAHTMRDAAKTGKSLPPRATGDLILVVNDNPEHLELMSAILRNAGYRTVTVLSGKDAFDAATRSRPNLIISDVSMPGTDGIELCRLIGEDERLDSIPVLLVSALRKDSESALEGLRAGAEDYIEAPYDPVRLVAKVAQLLERKAGENALRESERYFRTLIESASDMICLLDADGTLLYHSPSITRLLGYGESELCGKKILDFIHPDERAGVGRAISSLREAGQGMLVESHSFSHRDGSCRYFECTYKNLLDNPAVGGILLNARDTTERTIAEQSLRRSEAKYRMLMEQASDGICITDGHFILDVNTRGCEMLGYEREELIGLEIAKLNDNEDLGNAPLRLDEIYAGKTLVSERALRHRDGTLLQVEMSAKALEDGRIQAIVRDITERKSAEEALRSSWRQYDELLNSVEGIVWEADAGTFKFTFVSKQAEAILGYPIERWLSEDTFWVDHLYQEDIGWAVAACSMATRGGRSHCLEYRMVAADGRVVWLRDVVSATAEGSGPAKLRGIMVDITERKRAEETLRATEQSYRDLVENAKDIIYTHDLEGRYLTLNKAGEEITGYTRDEAVGKSLAQVIAPEYLEKAMEMVGQKLSGKGPTIYNLEILAKDGRRVAVEVSTMLLYRDGQPVAVQGIARDVTERLQLEEQLLQAQKMEAVGRLAGGIAHDFNNLLTAITGYSDLTLRRLIPENPLRFNIEEIKKASDRAASLTRQLLAFSRKQVLKPKVLDLNAVVSDMEKMLRRLIGEDIELRTALDSELGRVKADPGQIEQVIMNLAVNARDAMPHGGNLIIETENVYLNEGYAASHIAVKPGAYVMLAITDTGQGLNEETQSRIFEPFFTTKEVGKGTGLGLSMVYGIVKQSGGNIWVYSEVDKGTVFKIYLPRVEEAVQEYKRYREVEEPVYGNEVILLAEDDLRVRNLLREALEGYGYRVLEAEDGSAALSVSERYEGPIHLLLTDVVMPKISGRELADRIVESRSEIKVLYMSGYTDESIVHHGVLDAGTPFIQKPFEPVALARKIRKLLDKEARG